MTGLPVKKVTVGSTEADLEARIDAAIRLAFPFLPHNAIRHQTTFSFWFGGKEITINGVNKKYAKSRADVILYSGDKPLAVLELKKTDVELSEEDVKQGLSYARVLNPSPPIVIVSNGNEVLYYETYSGKEWLPTEYSEQAIQSLFHSAFMVASNDLKLAVSTLMGTNPEVWMQAISQTTIANIKELSGDWKDRLMPFVDEFLISRKATHDVISYIRSGENLVIVEGPPLSGKSNIIRELVNISETESDFIVLFVDADGEICLLQQISDIMSQTINWHITKEESRSWLQRISKSNGPKLVIAINGLGLNFFNARNEIVDLISPSFGKNLVIVLELDDTIADNAVLNSKKRGESAIGRRAKRIYVKPLDDTEFKCACKSLFDNKIALTNGSQYSNELRLPWVLRAIGSQVVNEPEYSDPNLVAWISPLLSLELIELARNTFSDDVRISFKKIAAAALKDSKDSKRPVSLMLESLNAYVIREKSLKNKLEELELTDLMQKGYIKKTLHESDEVVFVARIPELVASEASVIIAQKLLEIDFLDSENAYKKIIKVASSLPLGDIVAAQALIDSNKQNKNISLDLITKLINHPPKEEKAFKEGNKYAIRLQGVGTVYLTAQSEGLTVKSPEGVEQYVPFEQEESIGVIYSDFHPWLILSHLAGIPLEVYNKKDNEVRGRIEPAILMELGKCPTILRRPSENQCIDSFQIYEYEGHGSVVCNKSGIVESITLSIYRFIGREKNNAKDWILKALSTESFPLLARIEIALRELSISADKEVATFSQEMLSSIVGPFLKNYSFN
jgi:hypothetical protein